jgi:hypothetical protein
METRKVYSVSFALAAAALSAAAAAPARGAARTFTAASGLSAYVIAPAPSSLTGGILVRRLGLDGGVLWEDRWGDGRGESPVDAAVAPSGEVTVVGDDDAGCVAAHWSTEGRVLWSEGLQYGSSCRVRTALLDASGAVYVLATTTVGGVPAPTVWKLDARGNVLWSYRADAPGSGVGFDLAPIAGGGGVTVTTAVSTDAGWTYDTFDLDAAGRPRDPVR